MSPKPPKGFAAHPKSRAAQLLAASSSPSAPSASASQRESESRLIAAARKGNRRAAAQILESLSPTIYRFGMGFCRDPDQAEDLTQDVLQTLLAWLPRFRGESSLSTWAFTVARRVCVRRQRRMARMISLEGREDLYLRADASAGPAERLERRELAKAIESAVAALPKQQREVVVLRDVEGLPASEVAIVLGIGERAVKSRLHRARLALRVMLAPHAAPLGMRSVPDKRETANRCPDTALLLSRYLEGELDGQVCDRLAMHVAECAACSEACESLRVVLGACRRWGMSPIPAAERKRLQLAVREAVRAMVA